MIHYDRIILNLRRAGLTQIEIARRVGCAPSNISRLTHQHVEPRFMNSLRLLDLHLDMCPDRHRPEVIGVP